MVRVVRLAEVATINPRKPVGLGAREAEQVPFLAMADVSTTGRYRLRETRALAEVVEGYSHFAPGDVLLAKITPCFENGKAAHVAELPTDIGFGSTEFHVLRPGPRIDARYLFHLVWSAGFRRAARVRMRGSAGQKRVPEAFLAGWSVVLPDLAEQRRRARILDTADALRHKRRQRVGLLTALLDASFIERFGDPVLNPKRWPVLRFEQLCLDKPRNGLSPRRGGTHPGQVLTLDAITRGPFDARRCKAARFGTAIPPAKRVSGADLLVCRGNGNSGLVGQARFPDHDHPELVFPDTMIAAPIDLGRVTRAYLEQVWQGPGVRRQIEARARTTNGIHKINQATLRSIELPLPPLAEQQAFARVAGALGRARARTEAEAADALFESLVERTHVELRARARA